MLLTKTVTITWQRGTCTYYKSLGYKFTKIYDEFEVKVEDLTKGSHTKIECLCDYCLEQGVETIVPKEYREYVKSRERLEKDACSDCKIKKEKEVHKLIYGTEEILSLPSIRKKIKQTNIDKYGVVNPFQNEKIKDKIKETNLEKYGVEYYTQTEECQDKMSNTMLSKYGVKRYSQLNECKEQIKQTNLNKYGTEYYSQTIEYKERVLETNLNNFGTEYYTQTDEYKERAKETSLRNWGYEYPNQSAILKEKTKNTNIKNWGVDHPMKNKEFLEKQRLRIVKAMKEKGTVNYSKQQEYIMKLLNGDLNFLVDACFLDIAFPKEKLYIEYNGSGHDIQLRIGKMTEKEFYAKEIRRYQFLKSQGWKQIEIISKMDYIPNDRILINIFNDAKHILLNTKNNWIKYNIDDNTMELKGNIQPYDYGELRRIN